MNIRLPQNAGNFLTSWEPVSFSKRVLLHAVSYLPEGRAGAAWLLTKLCSFVAQQVPFTSSMLFATFYFCNKYTSLSVCLSVSRLQVASGSGFSSVRQHAAVCVWSLLQRAVQCMTNWIFILCLFYLQTDPCSLPCSQQPGESCLHPLIFFFSRVTLSSCCGCLRGSPIESHVLRNRTPGFELTVRPISCHSLPTRVSFIRPLTRTAEVTAESEKCYLSDKMRSLHAHNWHALDRAHAVSASSKAL